jgi:hypothetical protein
MRRIITVLFSGVLFLLVIAPNVLAQSTTPLDAGSSGPSSAAPAGPQTTSAAGQANTRTLRCGTNNGSTFLGLPTWYKYIKEVDDNGCPSPAGIEGIWAVVVAIVEFLLRLAVFVAVGLVIWGGVKMIMSKGEPEGIAAARSIIIHALIGLVITMVATGVVVFIGNQFKG